MSLLAVAGANSAVAGGYDIDNSLKLEQDNSERLVRNSPVGTSVSVTNATVSYWVKRTELGAGTMYTWRGASTWQNAAITSPSGYSDVLYVAGGNESYYKLVTNRVFRDTSAWYHIFIAYDTTQSTASDRIKIYINGVQETSFAVENYPSQNRDLEFLAANGSWIFGWLETAASVAPCYLAEAYLFHDQTLAPTDFGEFDTDTGIWKPIEYTGSFSQYDWYYDFENSASLGADASGNGNNITYTYNITSADQATDTPTNNFVTWIGDGTPWNATAGDNSYTKEGATTVYHGATTGWATIPTTQGVYGGKWYAELKWDSAKPNLMWGVLPVSRIGELPLNTYLGATDAHDGFGFYTDSTRVRYYEGTVVSPPQNLGLANGDIIQIAMDKDNGYVYFGINNTWTQDVNSVTGVPTSGSSGTGGWAMNYDDAYCFAASLYNPSASFPVNFGGYTAMTISSAASDANGYGNFEYAPPTGYYALCTKNLAQYGG